jgi:hypothetical protein
VYTRVNRNNRFYKILNNNENNTNKVSSVIIEEVDDNIPITGNENFQTPTNIQQPFDFPDLDKND